MTSKKSILITGASSGIGAALALHYAAAGNFLSLSGRREDKLEAVATACRAKGAKCETHILDVRHTSALIQWIEYVHSANPVDIAFINAGIAATRSSPECGERIEDIHAQIATNLGGTLSAAQTLGALMFVRGSGHLVLVSSLNALFPVAEAATYSATKAGILAYAKAIRDWLEPVGVHVTTVCPGFVRTDIALRYRGPRPFEISAAEAARRIAKGVAKSRRDICFPIQLVLAIRLSKWIPTALRRRILAALTAELTPLRDEENRRT